MTGGPLPVQLPVWQAQLLSVTVTLGEAAGSFGAKVLLSPIGREASVAGQLS